jgi:hypothetical protein
VAGAGEPPPAPLARAKKWPRITPNKRAANTVKIKGVQDDGRPLGGGIVGPVGDTPGVTATGPNPGAWGSLRPPAGPT